MSSYLNWHVGMKVVCVSKNKGLRHKPIYEGRVYTIRKVWSHPKTGEIGVLLQEVVNEIHPIYKMERGYGARRFRPLVTRKTDISIFTAMLHGTDQTVDA